MTNPTFPFEGTVSHGTLRSEDLLPRFLDVLEALNPLRAAILRTEGADILAHLESGLEPGDDVADYTADLMDALQEAAPEGYRFGAHEGDGSDFGFWREDGETIDVEVTYTFVVTVPYEYNNNDVAEAVSGYINSVAWAFDSPVSVKEV